MSSSGIRSPVKKNIRVILADDHHVVRTGIRAEIERHPDIEVIGEAANGHEAINLVQQLQPDVLVLDINMPELSGVEVTQVLSSSVKTLPCSVKTIPGRPKF
jgi:DNA-binding NarL/FixJ family response regulator